MVQRRPSSRGKRPQRVASFSSSNANMDAQTVDHACAAAHKTTYHHALADPLPRAECYANGRAALEPVDHRLFG